MAAARSRPRHRAYWARRVGETMAGAPRTTETFAFFAQQQQHHLTLRRLPPFLSKLCGMQRPTHAAPRARGGFVHPRLTKGGATHPHSVVPKGAGPAPVPQPGTSEDAYGTRPLSYRSPRSGEPNGHNRTGSPHIQMHLALRNCQDRLGRSHGSERCLLKIPFKGMVWFGSTETGGGDSAVHSPASSREDRGTARRPKKMPPVESRQKKMQGHRKSLKGSLGHILWVFFKRGIRACTFFRTTSSASVDVKWKARLLPDAIHIICGPGARACGGSHRDTEARDRGVVCPHPLQNAKIAKLPKLGLCEDSTSVPPAGREERPKKLGRGTCWKDRAMLRPSSVPSARPGRTPEGADARREVRISQPKNDPGHVRISPERPTRTGARVAVSRREMPARSGAPVVLLGTPPTFAVDIPGSRKWSNPPSVPGQKLVEMYGKPGRAQRARRKK
eukprot:gene23869-biopygen13402